MAQTAAAIQGSDSVHNDAVSTLLDLLSTNDPVEGLWTIFGEYDLDGAVYSTAQIMLGLGPKGWPRVDKARRQLASAALIAYLERKLLLDGDDTPFLVIRVAQALRRCDLLDSTMVKAVGTWADRFLYRCEASSIAFAHTASGIRLAAATGTLALTQRDLLTRSRVAALITTLVEQRPVLPEQGRESLQRVGDSIVGFSAIDALLLILRDDGLTAALLQRTDYVEALLQWLLEHSELHNDTRLFRSDLYKQEDRLELWFNAAVTELLFILRERAMAADSRETLRSLRGRPPAEPVSWADVTVGGYKWRELLETELISAASAQVPRGARLTRNGVVLFGPPGTGKTTIVKALAHALGDWPLVSLSPGTFLTAGVEGLVARITETFDQLCGLRQAVVLFDEFELLMLDRSGKDRFATWSSSLLTDVMLPLFQNLHDWGRNVYVVCTNDIGRIDIAARRGGRFDYVLPVGPPSVGEAVVLLRRWLPTSKDQTGLAEAADGRATVTELRQWATAIIDSDLSTAAALEYWDKNVAPHLEITSDLIARFKEEVTQYTSPRTHL